MLSRPLLAISTLSLCLSGCGGQAEKSSTMSNAQAQTETQPQDSLMPAAETPAPQPEPLTGHYKTILDCDDCQQRILELKIHPDQSYSLQDTRIYARRQRSQNTKGQVSYTNEQTAQLISTDQQIQQLQPTANGLEIVDASSKQPALKLERVATIEVSNALKHADIQAEHIDSLSFRDITDTVKAHDYYMRIHNQSDQPLKLKVSDIILVDQNYQEYNALVDESFLEPIPAQHTRYNKISFNYPDNAVADYIKVK